MNSHATALVPIETWCYNSPRLMARGIPVDLGLLCEALLYYDSVFLHVTTQPQFAALLVWATRSGHFDQFLELVSSGAITMYDYSFHTAPIQKDGTYVLMNIQDPIQASYGTFPRRFLYHRDVEDAVPNVRRRKRMYAAFAGRVIEVKADDFGPAIENARLDNNDHRRNAIVVQAFVDELYKFQSLGRPPEVSASITTNQNDGRTNITWNINFQELARLAGPKLGFHLATPLTGGAVCNRLLWSAAERGCDLFLGAPMACLVGDKLYETVRTPARVGEIVVGLKQRVEFPDVRTLVHDGVLNLGDILEMRAKAGRFRTWLQSSADRDSDAMIAYHHEVAKESKLLGQTRKTAISLV